MHSLLFYLLPYFFFWGNSEVKSPQATPNIPSQLQEECEDEYLQRKLFRCHPEKITLQTQLGHQTNSFDAWTVGDSTVFSTDFSDRFSIPGQYNGYLESGNGLFSQEFGWSASVIGPPASIDCESSFIKRFGNLGVNEESFFLALDGNGSYFIGGQTGANSLILQVDTSGNILMQRRYDFTNGNDFIANLIVDDEGYLVGSARDQLNANTTNILFKINWQTGNLLWAKKLDDTIFSRFDGVVQNPQTGNYLFNGTVTNSLNNYIVELGKNTGNVVSQYTSDYGGNTDVYRGGFATNNAVYFPGVGRLGGGLDEIRPTLTKFDLNGNLLWAKIHLRSPSQPSRLYNMDMFIENDTIINCGRGSLAGDDLTTSQLLFYKTNTNGGLILAKSYGVAGGNTTAGVKTQPIPNGYIVQGNYNEGGTIGQFFIARLDKLGNVVWAKKINPALSATGFIKPLMLVDGGFIVFAAQTTQYDTGQNNDLLFGRISLDGQVVGTGCDLIQDINLVANNISNPYDGSLLPTPLAINNIFSSSNHSPFAANLLSNEIAGCECMETTMDTCANGLPIHTTPDAVLQGISAQCNGDSMLVMLQVCNTDSIALPAGTPISFYQNNPIATAAILLSISSLPIAIAPGTCEQFMLAVLLPTNQQIFAVVNDNGSTSTPFNLAADFPNTNIQECDFTNNIASFSVNYNPPILNLGPDLTICNSATTVLDASPGFASYHWLDGSTGQTLTTSQPGVYSVTVTDQCGGMQSDEITLNLNPENSVDIGFDSVQICAGDSFTFTVSGYNSYQWSPASLVDCPNCPTVTVSPPSDACFIVVATDIFSCISSDTICVSLTQDTAFVYQSKKICDGDTLAFGGQNITQPGGYQAIDTSGQCVYITYLTLSFFDSTSLKFTVEPACPFEQNGVVTVEALGDGPFGFAWQNGLSSNQQLSGVGAGSYMVTVTDHNGCSVTETVIVPLAERPSVSSEVQDASCFGINDGVLTIIANDPSLQFSFKGATISHQTVYDSIWPGGDQFFTVDTFGCSWVSFFFVDSPDKIILNLPNIIEAPMCDSIQIKAESPTSPLTYTWTPNDNLSCVDCPAPFASPFVTTTYHLTVMDSNGCTATDSIHVLINFRGKAYIPNAFTPNNDGINDVFYVISRCVLEVRSFRIFDRWGELVFNKNNTPPNDPLFGWDGKFKGKDMNADVFVYYIQVALNDGTVQTYKGDVTLLR